MIISLKNDVDTILNFEGNVQKTCPYINFTANSSKLTIITNTTNEIKITGQASVIYKIINNSVYEVSSTLNLQNKGTVIQPFGSNYKKYNDQIMDLVKEYEENNQVPEEFAFYEVAKYYIQFVKDKIADIADVLNQGANDFTPINVELSDNDSSSSSHNKYFVKT